MTNKNTKFQTLVKEVKDNQLTPADMPEGIESVIDAYIKEKELAWVMNLVWANSKGAGSFFVKWEGEWMSLSWHKLCRDLPIVFGKAEYYKRMEATVFSRLKAAGRVYKNVKIKDVEFE